MFSWPLPFLSPSASQSLSNEKFALIILNQPFSVSLLTRLWSACEWRCCADGGANRLYDLLSSGDLNHVDARSLYLPNLIKGDLDSLRPDVREYYEFQHVPIEQDGDLYATDLMKCVAHLEQKERSEGAGEYTIILLGGLSGRLDQTVHTLHYLHKLRKTRKKVFAVTDENIGWVLDEGEHSIEIDHSILGPTCGLLPVGVDSTVLTTTGLRWNLENHESGFDGLVSTSNHFLQEEKVVTIKTSRPIWWCAELRTSPKLF